MQPEARQETKPNKEKEIKDLVKGFVGRDIDIMLRGKKSLKGRLESAAQYELLLTIAQKPVIVMKHAVDYIELVK